MNQINEKISLYKLSNKHGKHCKSLNDSLDLLLLFALKGLRVIHCSSTKGLRSAWHYFKIGQPCAVVRYLR